MDVGHLLAARHHDHGIGVTPLVERSPDPGDGGDFLSGQRVPCAGAVPVLAFGLATLRHRDQAASLGEAASPDQVDPQLVVAGAVDRRGLERLARRLADGRGAGSPRTWRSARHRPRRGRGSAARFLPHGSRRGVCACRRTSRSRRPLSAWGEDCACIDDGDAADLGNAGQCRRIGGKNEEV